MKYPVLDFLRPALIPELRADIAAGPARDAHLILVFIAAIRTFPDQLAVRVRDDLNLPGIATFHTVIALGI